MWPRLEVLCTNRVAEFFMEAEEKVLQECCQSTMSAGGIVMKRNERKRDLPFPPYRLNSLKLRHSSFLVLLAPPPATQFKRLLLESPSKPRRK